MKSGTQIIYIPRYAEGDVNHPSTEAGFVTSMNGDHLAWCRYWSRYYPGKLRTTANSELTALTDLIVKDTTAQHIVNTLIIELYELAGEVAW